MFKLLCNMVRIDLSQMLFLHRMFTGMLLKRFYFPASLKAIIGMCLEAAGSLGYDNENGPLSPKCSAQCSGSLFYVITGSFSSVEHNSAKLKEKCVGNNCTTEMSYKLLLRYEIIIFPGNFFSYLTEVLNVMQ